MAYMVQENVVVVKLQPEFGGFGLDLRVDRGQQEKLAGELRAVELPVRYGIEESAAQVLDIVLTFTGPISAGLGARLIPKEAWAALGQALVAFIGKNRGRRAEIHYGDGQKVVVENDRAAVKAAVDQLIPAVRQRMIDQQDAFQAQLREDHGEVAPGQKDACN